MASTSNYPAKTRRSLISPAMRRMWGFLAPHRSTLYAGLGFSALVAGIMASYGLLLKTVLEDITKSKTTAHLDRLGFEILGIFAVKGLLSFLQVFLINDAMQKMTRDLRTRVYAHIQSLPLKYFEDRRTGQLMSSITADVPVIADSFQTGVTDSIQAPIIVIGTIAVMLHFSPILTLTILAVAPPLTLVILAAGRRMKRAQAMIQARQQGITETLQETLAGVRIIKSFTAEKMETERFHEHSQDVRRAAMRAVRVGGAMSPIIEFIGMGGFVVVMWVGGRLIHHNLLTFEALGAFLLSLNQFGAASKSIGNINLTLRRLDAAAERVFTLLDTKSDLVEKPDAVILDHVVGDIVFDDVSFAYGDGPEVLHGLSFCAAPGEIVALVGQSGSGKTTIANLVPRFYDVTAGSVRVNGRDVRDYTLHSLRGNIGMVPQDTLLFSGTIRENIMYGRPDATDAEMRAASVAAHAETFVSSLPDGYETVVGERGAKLSGGQKQRVAIARALLKNARILILDEATSALDTESESLVQDALNRLMEGRTTLVIAHRLSTIRNADKILVLDAGRIIEKGTHDELLALGGEYKALYEKQFRDKD